MCLSVVPFGALQFLCSCWKHTGLISGTIFTGGPGATRENLPYGFGGTDLIWVIMVTTQLTNFSNSKSPGCLKSKAHAKTEALFGMRRLPFMSWLRKLKCFVASFPPMSLYWPTPLGGGRVFTGDVSITLSECNRWFNSYEMFCKHHLFYLGCLLFISLPVCFELFLRPSQNHTALGNSP